MQKINPGYHSRCCNGVRVVRQDISLAAICRGRQRGSPPPGLVSNTTRQRDYTDLFHFIRAFSRLFALTFIRAVPELPELTHKCRFCFSLRNDLDVRTLGDDSV